ncbi:MAG: hypothetical protein M3460_28770 [Actinomycetota bacterium]|nr:hypothetical protein [Actinomycetota bacterium]
MRRGTEEDLGLPSDLIGHSAEHQGYEPLSTDYLRALYRLLAPAGHVVLFIGEVHDTPMAAELYTACGGMLRLRLRGLDRSGQAPAWPPRWTAQRVQPHTWALVA